MASPITSGSRRQRGFSLWFLMVAVTLFAMAVLTGDMADALNQQREHERELLFEGNQFKQAIGAYAGNSQQGGAEAYPPSLDALLQDPRSSTLQRYLRRIYVDPMTRTADWGQVLVQGHVIGVYSRAQGKPLKRDGFDPDETAFTAAQHYSDWVFIGVPQASASSH